LYVEEDQLFELGLPDASDVVSAPNGVVASPSDPTTAFFFSRQWHHRAISADVAWANGALGSPDVTVAILDSGIDYTYPDLDGLVDLSRSASFQPGDDFYVDLFFPGRHPITDLHFHGTHVASTVASHGNTVAGVTSQTTLIGVKVCDVFGSCPSGALFAGIIHAADNGADVANMSIGGFFAKPALPGFVSVINRVTNYARQKGMLIVVAAGNFAWDLDHNGPWYSTYCDAPSVACVSATGPSFAPSPAGPFVDVDTPAPYTNYGRSAINVAAPGGNEAAGNGGWVWQACSQTSLLIPICQTGLFTLGLDGTSMASPHVAGVAALMLDYMGGAPAQIKAALAQTADDLGQPGTDPFYGKGRVNAATAAGY
jgi:subtilisin family serine protease